VAAVVRVAPSILSADFAALGAEIDRVSSETDLLHVDVMDGHFVPNLTIGPPVVAAIRRHTDAFLDCHLMMTNPGDYLEAFAKAGANHCSVHIEVDGTAALIQSMRDLGVEVGLAINPETPFEACEPWLDRIDLLLVMSVHPGFGGQHFLAEAIPKVARAAEIAGRDGLHFAIEVDGGIDVETVVRVAEVGADTFVAGSAIFGHPDPVAAARAIRDAATSATAGR
jgi:ribulose-phosphate 3-epimerase